MSWSEGRETKTSGESRKELLEKIDRVNGALKKLSTDDYLHKVLTTPLVKAAVDHWTNISRQPPEKAKQFEKNEDVIYVLQRIQMMQQLCRTLSIDMGLPLAHMYQRKTELTDATEFHIFGIYSRPVEGSKNAGFDEDAIEEISSSSVKAHEAENRTRFRVKTTEDLAVEKSQKARNVQNTKQSSDQELESAPTEAINVHNNGAVPYKGSLQYYFMWGHEDAYSSLFSWRKWFIRIVIDFVILALLSRMMAEVYVYYYPISDESTDLFRPQGEIDQEMAKAAEMAAFEAAEGIADF